MTNIQRGFRCKLEEHVNVGTEITVTALISGAAIYDFSCFGVDANNKLSDDRYMVFYNQTASPNNEIVLSQTPSGVAYRINLSRLPASINKLVFAVSIDGNGIMNGVNKCSVSISQSGSNKLQLNLTGNDFQNEKAVILVEIYRKDVWRFAAVANGFNGGLGDLLRAYGGEETAPVLPPSSAPQKISLEKRLEKEAPALLSLAKPLKLSLEKHKLNDTVAKVALVMDISGSMIFQYNNGTVQEIVNKILPIAVQFDDDGEIDFWYYGNKSQRMPAVTLDNYRRAVPADAAPIIPPNAPPHTWTRYFLANPNTLMLQLGGGNDEPVVMKDVIAEYRRSDLPAYVIFITDGGVSKENDIKRLLIEASRMPIFWQFVGVGGSNYGILQQLDTMPGRYIDNANFFALDDFRRISNEVLYDRLLTEFPLWLKEARAKKVIP